MPRILASVLILLSVVLLTETRYRDWFWFRGGFADSTQAAVLAWFGICVGLLIFIKPSVLSKRGHGEPPKKQ